MNSSASRSPVQLRRCLFRLALLLWLVLGLLPPRLAMAGNSLSARGAGAPGVPPNIPHVGAGWTALPNNGLNGNVSAFALCGGQLYVGGLFQQTADGAVTNLFNIARLNTTSNTWSALTHGGLDANVYALACYGSDLYVGGFFNQTFDGAVTNLHHIARFNTATSAWSALPHNGLSFGGGDAVNALAFSGSDLYVGGYFNQTADGAVTNLNYIARYSTTGNTWSALPHNGLSFGVYAFAVSGSDLYVGGFFDSTFDGAVTNLHAIARFSTTGNTWSALPNHGLDFEVLALAFNGGDLYVGGGFAHTFDGAVTNLNRIAKFSTTGNSWSALANHGLDGNVSSLASNGGDLYVGGLNFTKTFDGAVTGLNHIARVSTTGNAWSALPNNGLNGQVHALVFVGGDLFVGGLFNQTNNRPATVAAPQQITLNNVAKFPASQACNGVTLQQIPCSSGGSTLTVSATAAQFADGDVTINVSQAVSCGAQAISQVRVLTSDGVEAILAGPIGATSGTFAGIVPIKGASGPVDLKLYCDGNPTPITTVILSIVSVVLPSNGTVGWGCCLSVRLANAGLNIAQVTLYYKDPSLGDVIWNANAYNQLNPQFTTAGANGQYGWNVPSGQYFVKVSAPCFQTAQSSVITVPPAITNTNFTLQPVVGCRSIFLPLMQR